MADRRGWLDRLATRAVGGGTPAPGSSGRLPGMGQRPTGNVLAVQPGGRSSGGGLSAATQPITYASPGQPMWLEWDAQRAVDQGYYASLWVMRCVRTIADTVAGLPFRAGASADEPANFDPEAPLAKLLGPAPGAPNPKTASRALWAWSVVQYLVTGRFGWEVQRDPGARGPDGKPAVAGFWPLVSAGLQPIPSIGKAQWWDGFIYQTPMGAVPMGVDQVAYSWRSSARDFRQPESYLEAANLAVSIEVGIQRFMWNLLKNGLAGTYLVVTPPFEESDMRRAWQDQFLQEFTGFDNAGKTIFGEAEIPEAGARVPNIQVEKLGTNPVDAQLLQMWQQAKIDITVALGVPESLIGNASQRTYANADSEYRNFWTLTMLTILRELEDHINTNVAPLVGEEVGWFDLSNVVALQAPTIFTPPSIKDAIDEGVATASDVANILGIPDAGASVDVDTAELGEEASAAGGGGKRASHRLEFRGRSTRTVGQQEWRAVPIETRAVAAPSRSDLADKVYGYLARNYPDDTLDWVHDAEWQGPKRVPLDQIQMDRRPGGRDDEKTQGIAKAIQAGKPMDPVVLVNAPGSDKLKVADGYHRTLAHRRAGRATVAAFVGKTAEAHGAWEREMHDRKLNRALTLALASLPPLERRALAVRLGLRYDVSPLGQGKNWVTDVGGLPLFVRAIAHALVRNGHSESEAIQIAVGTVQRWARGQGKVTPKTRAKAAAALAEWEAKKVAAHATRDGMGGVVTEAGSAGALLPVGQPRPPRPRRATMSGPHAFTGTNPAACAACGMPAAAQIHRTGRRRRRVVDARSVPAPKEAARVLETRHRGSSGHLPMQTGHVGSSAERQRAARKVTVSANQDSLMPNWERTISLLFDQQKAATLSRLKGKRGRQMLRRAAPPPETPEGTSSPSPDPGAIFDQGFWTQKTLGVLQPMYLGIGATGRAQVLGQLGLSDTPPNESAAASAVNALLDQRANLLSGQVTDTTFRQIVEALQAGVADGEGIEALAKRVEAVFSDATRNRARTIARTEVVGAMNQVANAYANGLPAGVVGAHEWLCVAAGTRVSSGQPVEVVERRRSAGWLTVLSTHSGRILTVTPNHPILTSNGWVAAHSLSVGDQLVCQAFAGLRTGLDPGEGNTPALIDEVFSAAALSRPGGGMVTTVPDLYSEPTDCKVEVVPLNGHLAAQLGATLDKQESESVLMPSDIELATLVQAGALRHELVGAGVFRTQSPLGGCPVHGSQSFTLRIASDDQGPGLGPRAEPDLSPSEMIPNGGLGNAEALGQGVGGLPFAVSLDELVDIETQWSGAHAVYDLVTVPGWFVAEGIVVHNSHHDERTRPTHRAADGQVRPLDQPFYVGGFPMMHPGDPTAPPGETINCRCAVAYLPSNEATARLVGPSAVA